MNSNINNNHDAFSKILNENLEKISRLKDITSAIEAGTYRGDNAVRLATMFEVVETIELYPDYNPYDGKSLREVHENIKKQHPNINFIYDNSVNALKTLLTDNPDTCYFILLDAHTANYSPMIDELNAIKTYSKRNDHIIMIDDCRFLSKNGFYTGYPTFEEMQTAILNINPNYVIENTKKGNDIHLIY